MCTVLSTTRAHHISASCPPSLVHLLSRPLPLQEPRLPTSTSARHTCLTARALGLLACLVGLGLLGLLARLTLALVRLLEIDDETVPAVLVKGMVRKGIREWAGLGLAVEM